MSKSLRNSTDKIEVAKRRFSQKVGGLGFWAAVDCLVRDPVTKFILAREVNKKYQKKA